MKYLMECWYRDDDEKDFFRIEIDADDENSAHNKARESTKRHLTSLITINI